MLRWTPLLALTACGRLGFDATGEGPGADAMLHQGPCAPAAAPADPLLISGVTQRVTSIGTMPSESGVAVEARTAVNGRVLAATISDADGNYILAIPTCGLPIRPVLTLAKSGLWTSVFVPDGTMDRNIAAFYSPMGTATSVPQLYNAVGVTRDPARGTIFVDVVDCGGEDIEGVVVKIEPAPERIVYPNGLCIPSGSGTATMRPCTFAWGLNLPTGVVRITGSRGGAVFLEHEVEILPGENFMGTTVRPVQ